MLQHELNQTGVPINQLDEPEGDEYWGYDLKNMMMNAAEQAEEFAIAIWYYHWAFIMVKLLQIKIQKYPFFSGINCNHGKLFILVICLNGYKTMISCILVIDLHSQL